MLVVRRFSIASRTAFVMIIPSDYLRGGAEAPAAAVWAAWFRRRIYFAQQSGE
jgi:hypothetical protein